MNVREWIVDGLTVIVCRKKIKTLRMTVLPPDGIVRISCPFQISEEEVLRFIRDQREWIGLQQARVKAIAAQNPQEYVTGETLWLLGKPCPLEVREGERVNGVWMENGCVILSVSKTLTAEQRALLEQYERLVCERQNKALEETYKKGFQRGARLMAEIYKE